MNQVMSVTGLVAAADLGRTLPHEHLFINHMREHRLNGVLNNYGLICDEVRRFLDLGGSTIVDCTSGGLERNPDRLRQLAEDTGATIIMGCGFYRDPYLEADWFDRNDADAIADVIVKEIEVGVADSGVRPGIIGEVGCNQSYLSAREERSLRAAAKAQRRTGLTLTTHAPGWPVGTKQLDVFMAEGVDPRRVIIGHCDTVPAPDYHVDLARRGAYVQFDTINGTCDYETELRVEYVLNLVRHGFIDQVLLSQDVCLRSHLRAYGGTSYGFILESFVPRLHAAGLTAEELDRILMDNPARALTGAAS